MKVGIRFLQLLGGLALFAVSQALLVRSRLGLDPWDVFHQGLSRQTGLAIGTWTTLVGLGVLLLWIPLRQKPGIGTLCNAVLIGLFLNVILDVMPAVHGTASRWLCLVVGIVLCGVATGAYIGAAFGPGPRDGLMVGLANRGHSLRVMRTMIELTVLGIGYFMGGTVGVGTVLFAVSIGPLAHITIPFFSRGPRQGDRGAAAPRSEAERIRLLHSPGGGDPPKEDGRRIFRKETCASG